MEFADMDKKGDMEKPEPLESRYLPELMKIVMELVREREALLSQQTHGVDWRSVRVIEKRRNND